MSDGKTRRYMNEREWLCFEDGVKYERERVIQLLEAQCDCAFFDKYELPSKCHAHKHIALINGENKPFITAKQAEELTNEMLEE